MADSDPISDSTPNKRRRLNNSSVNRGKAWDSGDDSGEELTHEDFETAATIPLPSSQKRKLQYTPQQFHSDISSMAARPSSPKAHITQPTQTLSATQPTQPLAPRTSPAPVPSSTSDVLVDRSSPLRASSPQKPQPQPIRRAPFAKPGGILANAMAPPGTSFRRPANAISQAQTRELSSDSEDDPPPRRYSDDDEETQGLSSNLKPTNFRAASRETPSTNKIVRESPRPSQAPSSFSTLMQDFGYSSPSTATMKPADDMISAYGSTSRAPRPPPMRKQSAPSRAIPAKASNAIVYHKLEDIDDYVLRRKAAEVKDFLDHETVQRCMDALSRKKGNVQDAIEWLTVDEEQDAPGENDDDADELADDSTFVRRGVATPKVVRTQSSQTARPTAKQEVKAPSKTIAEKYQATQAARRPSQIIANIDEDDSEVPSEPRRRLKQGRKAAARSPTHPSSPPRQRLGDSVQRVQKQTQAVRIHDSDSESDSGAAPQPIGPTSQDLRLLRFFNECSVQDLVDLSTQPGEVVNLVIESRPYASLAEVEEISNATKSGKKSKAQPIGEKIVRICSEVWAGYDAVDELVEQCELIAKPIQEALKSWGVGTGGDDGELQIMNLDGAHDSGIGTPSSSCPSDEMPTPRTSNPKSKGRFLSQPETMSSELTLKDYQLVGLNWLNLLWSKKISCILADDMGLGKTCQVIAFFAHLKQQNVDGVHLVIVPGSTLENWLREFDRFAPELKCTPYYASKNDRPALQYNIDNDLEIDVVVTTYDMAKSPDDNRFLRRLNPLVCVYDEAHALRNPKSDRYTQLMRIPAAFRILLTGTPLQNNLQELVAILAFLMPEMFTNKSDELEYIFQHKAKTSDADHAALLSAQRINRARSMMTPFILRRKKAQVLDLPTKHSRVEYCDMTSSQERYYGDLVEEAQQMFAEQKKNSKARKTKQSSNVLMGLRQAAIHPLLARRIYNDKKIEKIVDLLLKNPEFAGNDRERTRAYIVGEHHQSFKGGDYGLHCFCLAPERPYLHKFALKREQWMDAGKIETFKRLVTGFVKNKDRILVFSQFTTMMNILEAVLETLNVKFLRLDGQTDMNTRQDMIDKFTDDESIPLFMLSTRAGGAGINLACANKVIIFDSGFNPQDDIQAENRAHRVGQTREVEVVRLVTRGTIEEQIHALGESKLALDERVAGEGASAAEDKEAEKAGAQMVEEMFLKHLGQDKEKKAVQEGSSSTVDFDLKDAFKSGLEGAGLKVASKQAQF